MTTLPTTSSIRLPRPGGPGGQVLAMPAAQLGPAMAPAQQPLLTPADIWRVLRGNLWLIILLAVVGGAIAWGLFEWQKRVNPRYRATGTVLVGPNIRTTGKNGMEAINSAEFELVTEAATQAQMLMQPNLWSRVIEKNPKIRELGWWKEFDREVASRNVQDITAATLAKEDLNANFVARPQTGTKLLVVSMDAGNPDDAKEVLEAIVNAHIIDQQQKTYNRSAADLEAARKWKERYGRDMVAVKQRMNDVMSKIGAMTDGSTPLSLSRLNIKEMEISQLVSAQLKSKMEMTTLQGQLDAVMAAIQAGQDPPQVEVEIRTDPMCAQLRQTVNSLDVEIEILKKNGGEKNRYVQDMQFRRDMTNAKLEKYEAEVRASARNSILDGLKAGVQGKRAEVESLSAQVDSRRTELGELSTQIADYYSLKDEYDSIRTLDREMDERIAMLTEATRNDITGIQWQSQPIRPEERVSPTLRIYLPAGVVLGLALALGIAFLRELMDTSVRSPRDIAKVGLINLLGMIADESEDPQLAGVPLHVVISQAPHSIMAEQFRQVRTRLQHAASLDTTRTIVITSPGPSDGKSTIACNLAAGLALNGRRILLVDANFRRPELHKLFSVPNEVGFANVLDSIANLESAVQKTNIPNLELLPTGPKAANPTELLESQLFSDFIDRSLEEYDHVIFDTGPLLVVSEAIALAPRVDGVITVVRAKKNSRGMLTRVRETLKQIKAEHLGVVLNGVQNWGGGYYARNIKTYYAYQNAE